MALRREVLAASTAVPWRKRGNTASVSTLTHQAALRFVTSKWSHPGEYEFAVEGLVLSRAIVLYEGRRFPVRDPASEEGHWQHRVPEGASPWWVLSETQRPAPADVVEAVRDGLLPGVSLHMSDEVLLDRWRGVTEGPATVQIGAAYLGVLAVSTGDEPVLEAVREYMQRGAADNPSSRWFDDHLKRLRDFQRTWSPA